MKRIVVLLAALAACFPLNAPLFGQTSTGELNTDQRKVIWRTNATPPGYGTNGLQASGSNLSVGTVNGYRQRTFFQWSLPDEVIPDGCTIESVRLQFTAPPNGHSYPLYYFIANISYDLTSSTANSTIFEAAANSFYSGQYDIDYTVDLTWNGPTSPIAQAISQQLSSNWFTVGFYANTEGVYSYNWVMQDWTMKLTIWYTPQSTTLHQQLETTHQEYGKVGLWESNAWHAYDVPTQPFPFPVYSTQTVRADTLFASGTTQKHHDWGDPSKVINHGDHYIDVGTRDITSNFQTAHNATIQAQLIDGGNPGGAIDFKNPWLRDNVDAKGWLSRGTNAIPHSVSYSMSNVGTGTVHQGVFLNQSFAGQNPAYYSVGAPNPNTIGNFTGYFVNWEGNNVTFQNANSAQTGIVFTNSGAAATAKYKAHLGTTVSHATSTNSQRKMVQDESVPLSAVYESMGKIWCGDVFPPSSEFAEMEIYNGGNASTPSIAASNGSGWTNQLGVEEEEVPPSLFVTFRTFHDGLYDISFRERKDGSWQTPEWLNPYSEIPEGRDPHPVIGVTGRLEYPDIVCMWEGEDGLKHRIGHRYQGNIEWGDEEFLSGSSGNDCNPSISSSHGTLDASAPLYITYDDGSDIHLWDYRDREYYRWRDLGVADASITPTSYSSQVAADSYGEGADKVHVVWEALPLDDGQPTVMYQLYQEEKWLDATEFVNYNGAFFHPTITQVASGNKVMAWDDGSSTYKAVDDNSGNGWQVTEVSESSIYPNFATNGTSALLDAARFVATSTTGAPYALGVSGETSDGPNGVTNLTTQYSRKVVVAQRSDSSAYFMVELSPLTLKLANGNSVVVNLTDSLLATNETNAWDRLATKRVTFASGIDSIIIDGYARAKRPSDITGNGGNGRLRLSFEIIDANTGAVLHTVGAERLFAKDTMYSLRLRERVINARLGSRELIIRPRVRDLALGRNDMVYSMIHVYRVNTGTLGDKGTMPLAKSSETSTTLPTEFALAQNYPNPFNPTTVINYDLPVDSRVTLKLYDVLGKEVATIVDGYVSVGYHHETLNAAHLSSGVYFYRITAGNFTQTRKLLLLR